MDKKHAGKKIHELSLFIFRRDHRLQDNTGLIHSLRLSETVIPCFFFDSNQIEPSKNSYFSNNQVQFMIESLKDLNSSLNEQKSRLFLFNGSIEDIMKNIMKNVKPNAIFVNEDVTPYSQQRDAKIKKVCDENKVKFYSFEDIMLLKKNQVMLANGNFYQKFTPYYRAAQAFTVDKVVENDYTNYEPKGTKLDNEFDISNLSKFYKPNPNLEVHGGRKEALKIVNNLKKFKNYDKIRNDVTKETTKLSAYNKFGCVSIRELYYAARKEFGRDSEFVKQLFWRDFYYNIMYYYPHVVGGPMKKKYEPIVWENDEKLFEKWKKGETGCPVVDAAMRHLKTTGYMPNRLRMVVSNYLVKDLLIDWRWGEKYFAQTLVDYDLSQNSGGWQWSAGCGTDSQPYFRVFNPTSQSKKSDETCQYILKWCPELKNVRKEHIHNWEESYDIYKNKNIDYPKPLIQHQKQKQKFLTMYKKALYGDDIRESDDEGSDDEEEVKPKKKGQKKRKDYDGKEDFGKSKGSKKSSLK